MAIDDFEQTQLDLMQRRKKAQEGQTFNAPEGQMVSGRYVAPNFLQVLAEGLRGYGNIQDEKKYDKELSDLRGERKTVMANVLREYQTAMTPTPAVASTTTPTQMPSFDDADAATMQGVSGYGATTGAQAAKAPDYRAAGGILAASPFAQHQTAGLNLLGQIPQMEATAADRVETRSSRAQEVKDRLEAQAKLERERAQDRKDLEAQRAQDRKDEEERRRIDKIESEKRRADDQANQTRLAASLRTPTPKNVQIIQTDTGPVQLVDGVAMPIVGPGGKPIGPVKTPETLERTNNANAALATIKQARDIIPKATGSYLGEGVDQLGRVVGFSTAGAKAGAQLKALEGDLVSKMPKMSGPQSDKDVALYRQMAGVIGDTTTPPATKLAALNTIEEIQKRYAGQTPMTPPSTPTALPGPRPQNLPQTGRIRFDAQGNIIQ
jgi:hypothetical protein